MHVGTILKLIQAAAGRWYQDNPFRLGAALAYYTIFSVAPIAVIAVGLAGLVFGEEEARAHFVEEVNRALGPQVGTAIERTSQFIQQGGSGWWSTITGLVMLLLGATAVFAQLQDALNTIWGVKPREGRAWLGVIKDRFWSFMIVLSIGFLLLGSLLISIALSALTELLPAAYHPNLHFWRGLDWFISFGLVTTLFAMIYKLLPDVELEWRDVWVGAAVTAVLFTVGRYLIGLYLAQSSWISAYGAAGSLVIVLLWVYYSSQVFLFGAAFTCVWATESGKPLVPRANAEPATEEARARQGTPQRCVPAHEDARMLQ